jgi:hypothetical protein
VGLSPDDIRAALEDVHPDRQWIAHANCLGVGPAMFFPLDPDTWEKLDEPVGKSRRRYRTVYNADPRFAERVEEAQGVCAGCSVREECLEYALKHNIEHGVWGGTSERERRRIARRRRQAG